MCEITRSFTALRHAPEQLAEPHTATHAQEHLFLFYPGQCSHIEVSRWARQFTQRGTHPEGACSTGAKRSNISHIGPHSEGDRSQCVDRQHHMHMLLSGKPCEQTPPRGARATLQEERLNLLELLNKGCARAQRTTCWSIEDVAQHGRVLEHASSEDGK